MTGEKIKEHRGWLVSLGGQWLAGTQAVKFQQDPRQAIFNHVSKRDRELAAKKEAEKARRDKSVLSKPAEEIVSKDVQKAIMKGKEKGVADKTLEGQVEDVAKLVEAFEDNRRAFVLAAGTGTGKTFVIGGFAKEALARGVKKVIFVTGKPTQIAQRNVT